MIEPLLCFRHYSFALSAVNLNASRIKPFSMVRQKSAWCLIEQTHLEMQKSGLNRMKIAFRTKNHEESEIKLHFVGDDPIGAYLRAHDVVCCRGEKVRM